MPVDEFSTPVLMSAKPSDSVNDLLSRMKEKGFRHIPVLENNKPVGIISDRDLYHIGNTVDRDYLCARDIMIKEPYYVLRGTPIDEVAFEMSTRKIGSALIVNEQGTLDSIFTSVDGLNALIEIIRGEYEE